MPSDEKKEKFEVPSSKPSSDEAARKASTDVKGREDLISAQRQQDIHQRSTTRKAEFTSNTFLKSPELLAALNQAQESRRTTGKSKSCTAGSIESGGPSFVSATFGRSQVLLDAINAGKPEKIATVKRDLLKSEISDDAKSNDKTQSTTKLALNGAFQSPNGQIKWQVKDGNCYDSEGRLQGSIEEDGKFKSVNSQVATDLNSKFDGWQFKGDQNSQQREFRCDSKASNGKLFLQTDEKSRVECIVQMGMIIDKSSNEQIGTLSAPVETLDGKLLGGKVKFKGLENEISLADLKDCSFDLQVMGQSGVASRRLQGVCLGADKLADGRPKNGSGGIFNVQDALETLERQRKKLTEAEADNAKFHPISSLTGEKSQKAEALKEEHFAADAHIASLKDLVASGDLKGLLPLRRATELAKIEKDPLLAMRRKIESGESSLEDLPADSKQLSGSLRVLIADANGKSVPHEYQIKNGTVFDEGKSAFSIETVNGQLFIRDLKSNGARPAHELPGALWNLQIVENQVQKNLQWVSTGSQFVSLEDLRGKALECRHYAKTLNEQSGSAASSKKYEATVESSKEFLQKLNDISKNGINNEADLSFVIAGPSNVRKALLSSAEAELPPGSKSFPDHKIELPILSDESDPSHNKFSPKQIKEGRLRIGGEQYELKADKIFQNGRQVATLQPGYVLSFDDGHKIALAQTNRVVMRFTFEGDASLRENRILGLGPSRIAEDGRRIQGGLVQADQISRESLECKQNALEGNRKYFANKPYLNEMLRMDSIDKSLEQFQQSVGSQVGMLDDELKHIFDHAFNNDLDNNNLDHRLKITQNLVTTLGVTSSDSQATAQEGLAAQKQVNDAMVTGVSTALTGGLSSWLSTGYALAAGTVTGAIVSGVGRSSANSNDVANVVSGGVEGFTNALGGVGSKWLKSSAAEKIGAAGAMAFRAADAVVQSTLFSTAAAIRENDFSSLNLNAIVVGSCAQYLGGIAGEGVNRFTEKLSAAVTQKFARNLENVASALNVSQHEIIDALKANSPALAEKLKDLGVSQAKLDLEIQLLYGMHSKINTFGEMPNAFISGYVNGFNGALIGGVESQRERIANELGISRAEIDVNNDLFLSRFDWDEMAEFCHESAVTAAATATITSSASKYVPSHQQEPVASVSPDVESSTHNAKSAKEPLARESAPRAQEPRDSLSERLAGMKKNSKTEAQLQRPQAEEHSNWVKSKSPTGDIVLEAPYQGGGRIEQRPDGKIAQMRDANNVSYTFNRNQNGELTHVECSNGEKFVLSKEGWVFSKGNENTRLLDFSVSNDGTIKFRKELFAETFTTPEHAPEEGKLVGENGEIKKNGAENDATEKVVAKKKPVDEEHVEEFVRRPDGSLSNKQGRLIEANLAAETSKLSTLISAISNHTDKMFADIYLKAFPTRQGFAGWSDLEVAKTFHELSELLTNKSPHLSSDERAQVAMEIMANLVDTYSLNQGFHNTCAYAGVSIQLYSRCPSEAVRIIKEAVQHAKIVREDGQTIKLGKFDIKHDRETMQAHKNEIMQGNADPQERTLADKILQNALANAHWQSMEHGKDGKTYKPGEITWECNQFGEGALKAKGVKISDSPGAGGDDMQELFYQMTGTYAETEIVHSELGGIGIAEFSDEKSLIAVMRDLGVSPSNPITMTIHCSAEPFYTDSNAGFAGGSGGYHALCLTRPPVKINGEWYAYTDNTWGPSAEHTAHSGKPIRLRDLYLATLPHDSIERINALEKLGQESPLRYLEYLRAREARNKTVEKDLDSLDGWRAKALLKAEESRGLIISKEEHLEKLKEFAKDISDVQNKSFKMSDEERALALKYAAATIKRLESEMSEPRPGSKSRNAFAERGSSGRKEGSSESQLEDMEAWERVIDQGKLSIKAKFDALELKDKLNSNPEFLRLTNLQAQCLQNAQKSGFALVEEMQKLPGVVTNRLSKQLGSAEPEVYASALRQLSESYSRLDDSIQMRLKSEHESVFKDIIALEKINGNLDAFSGERKLVARSIRTSESESKLLDSMMSSLPADEHAVVSEILAVEHNKVAAEYAGRSTYIGSADESIRSPLVGRGIHIEAIENVDDSSIESPATKEKHDAYFAKILSGEIKTLHGMVANDLVDLYRCLTDSRVTELAGDHAKVLKLFDNLMKLADSLNVQKDTWSSYWQEQLYRSYSWLLNRRPEIFEQMSPGQVKSFIEKVEPALLRTSAEMEESEKSLNVSLRKKEIPMPNSLEEQSKLKSLIDKVSNKIAGEAIDEKIICEALEHFPEHQREQLLEIIAKCRSNMSLEFLMAEKLQPLAAELQASGFVQEKRSQYNDTYREIKPLCAGNASSGHLMAYLFRGTGIGIDIHSLNGTELTAYLAAQNSKNVVNPASADEAPKFVSFDRVKAVVSDEGANVPSRIYQFEHAQALSFAESVNFIDLALAKMDGPKNIVAKLERLLQAEQSSKPADKQDQPKATFQALSNEHQSRIKQMVQRNEARANLVKAKTLAALSDVSRNCKIGMEVLLDIPTYVSVDLMLRQARRVGNILAEQLDTKPVSIAEKVALHKSRQDGQSSANNSSGVGAAAASSASTVSAAVATAFSSSSPLQNSSQSVKKPLAERLENIVFVTDVDGDGSSHFVNYLFREACGMTDAKYDSQFVSLKQLGKKEADQLLSQKTIVALDDYVYSGTSAVKAFEHVHKQLKRLELDSVDPERIVIASLGGYVPGLKFARKELGQKLNCDSKHVRVFAATIYEQLHESHNNELEKQGLLSKPGESPDNANLVNSLNPKKHGNRIERLEPYPVDQNDKNALAKNAVQNQERKQIVESKAELLYDAHFSGTDRQKVVAPAALVLPYMIPNNMADFFYKFFRYKLGMRSSGDKLTRKPRVD